MQLASFALSESSREGSRISSRMNLFHVITLVTTTKEKKDIENSHLVLSFLPPALLPHIGMVGDTSSASGRSMGRIVRIIHSGAHAI